MSNKKGKARKAKASKNGAKSEAKEQPKTREGSLRSLVLGLFSEAHEKSRELPALDKVHEKVKERFPGSAFLKRPDVHYSYYKALWAKRLGTTAREYAKERAPKKEKAAA